MYGYEEIVALCHCDCGNKTEPLARNILRSSTTSCGCVNIAQKKTWSGDSNPNWRDGATSKNMLARSILDSTGWAGKIHDRFDRKCSIEGCAAECLEAHHIYNFSSYDLLRASLDNGISFCEKHHIEYHGEYGYHYNNVFEVIEFLKDKSSEASIDKLSVDALLKKAVGYHDVIRENKTASNSESKYFNEHVRLIKDHIAAENWEGVYIQMLSLNFIPESFAQEDFQKNVADGFDTVSVIWHDFGVKWSLNTLTLKETCSVVTRAGSGWSLRAHKKERTIENT